MFIRMLTIAQMKEDLERMNQVIALKDNPRAFDILGPDLYVGSYTEEHLRKIKIKPEKIKEYRDAYELADEIRKQILKQEEENRKNDIPKRIAQLEKELKELKSLLK